MRENAIKILIVDDKKENLLSLQVILADRGYQFVEATSGKDALRILLKNQDFAIILMDVQMPAMDGLEATRQIRKIFDRQPLIVAMTANAMAEDREACLNAGMDDYMSKPINLERLLELLKSLFVTRSNT